MLADCNSEETDGVEPDNDCFLVVNLTVRDEESSND